MTTEVGRSSIRSDGVTKTTGKAIFGTDVILPGMLHARLLRSTVPAGRIVALDLSRVAEFPGVHGVLTAADIPNQRSGLVLMDAPLFASEFVRFEGEPIAAVVAETRTIANQALALASLEIEEIPSVGSIEEAIAPNAPLVHPDWESFATPPGLDWPRSGNIVAETCSDPDGVDEAFAGATTVVEDQFETGRQYQAYMEPRMAVAEFDGQRFTIHVAHQFPYNVRDRVAAAIGVHPSEIRVVGHHIGGGFGAKLDTGLEPYAALLARRFGRPVRLANDRSEDLLTCQSRDNAVIKIRTAIGQNGELLARDVDVLMDSGASATDIPFLASIPMHVFGSLYRIGPVRIRTRAVYTNTAPTGAFRGVNGTHLYFALERHMDHIANRLDIDRLEYRRSNLQPDGSKLPTGQVLDDAGILSEAFDAVEQLASWTELGQGPNRGVGIAACMWLTNPMPGSATLKLNSDGSLGVLTAATENGSGAIATGVRQIAAEEFGLPADKVVVTMPDTDAAAFDAGSQGSRTTHIVGRAVREAAIEVRAQILDTAANMLEAAPEDLELANEMVSVSGSPSKQVSLAEVAATAQASSGPISGTGSYTTPMPPINPTCASGLLFPGFPTPTYHVHVAEVEIDPTTGIVRVLRYLVAQEVGKAINPQAVRGQIQGGVAQGLGYALWETLQIDAGRYSQRTLEAYGLPLATDIPEVEIVLLEHPDPAGPYGAKGVAEPPIIPVAAAIGNAVEHAIGKSVDTIPITAERVLEALSGS